MEKNELIEKLNAALADEFEVELDAITPDASIKETLELDSLSLVDMVVLVESEFDVKIDNAEIAAIKTFGNLYDYLDERIA